ncbi:MAG: trypsin-like peptidase domain-containing protein [Planctomycetota bacterium]
MNWSLMRQSAAIILACGVFSLAGAEGGKLTLLNQMQIRHVAIHEQVTPAVVEVQSFGDKIRVDRPCYGTGVVISAEGLVLTSITAVPDVATTVKVTFPNGQIHNAEFVAYDPTTEVRLLRVLKLEGMSRKFDFVELADSTQTRVGELAYTAGNPFQTIGRDRQVAWSIGTVSGIYSIESADEWAKYKGLVFETDAAVNPGSDGGPLFDSNGRLLGILSLAYCESRWLGSAIPIHFVKKGLEKQLAAIPMIDPKVPFKGDSADGARAARDVMEGLSISSRTAQAAMVKLIVQRPVSSVPKTVRAPGDKRPLPNNNRPNTPVSGVLFDPAGYILTSAFNVENDDGDDSDEAKNLVKITVVLSNGMKLPAKQLGRHNGQDVAVLKIDVPPKTTLPFIPLARDPELVLGRYITVLGASEDGAVPTRTMGIVSAVDRLDGGVVQTDALINYGNAGGAVVDLRGRLVGIASQLKLNSDWSQPNSGVGFFAQSDKILAYMDDLKMALDIRKPLRDDRGTHVEANAYDLQGVKVDQRLTGSLAWEANLIDDDVIVAIDGMDTPNPLTLVQVLKAHAPGDSLDITFVRNGKTRYSQVKMPEKAKK